MNQDVIVRDFHCEVPLTDFKKYCLNIPQTMEACAACPRYGTVWSCPPFEEGPEAFWNSFQTIELFGKKLILSEALREPVYTMDQLTQESKRIMAPYKDLLREDLLNREKGYPGSYSLSVGACEICEECTRKKGDPCLHPEQMRPSVEAIGGLVTEILKRYFGEELAWGERGHLAPHLFLLTGLLKK
mgnify:CR=1 FL=1